MIDVGSLDRAVTPRFPLLPCATDCAIVSLGLPLLAFGMPSRT